MNQPTKPASIKIPLAHALPTEEGYYFYYGDVVRVFWKTWHDGSKSLRYYEIGDDEAYSISHCGPNGWSYRFEIESEGERHE